MGILTVPPGIIQNPSSGIDTSTLEAWWNLDETTGDRLDSTANDNDLNPGSAGVSSTTGKIGNASLFTATTVNNTYLELPSVKSYALFSGVFYLSVWVYPTSSPNNFSRICAMYTLNGNSTDRFYLGMRTNREIQFRIIRIGGVANDLLSSSAITLNQWSLVEIYIDPSNSDRGISINNAAFSTNTIADIATGVGTSQFFIGNRTQTAGSESFPGAIDIPNIWSSLPDTDRRDYIWNGGAGNTFPS